MTRREETGVSNLELVLAWMTIALTVVSALRVSQEPTDPLRWLLAVLGVGTTAFLLTVFSRRRRAAKARHETERAV